MKKILLLLLTFISLAFFQVILAQVYPVRLSGSLIPPYSLNLSDYGNERANDLMLNATLNDPVESFRNVYFRIRIENNWQEIYRTDPNYLPMPIRLEQFGTEFFDGNTLSAYFNAINLVGGNGMTQNVILPEGFNRICVQVMDYEQRVPISNELCLTGNFVRNQVPILQLPNCNAEIKFQETQNILFNWTPMHLGSGNAPRLVEYKFEIVELLPSILNANDAFLYSLSVYSTITSSPSLIYTPSEPLLEKDKTYAWRVQAFDPQGSNLFENQGFSQACLFSFIPPLETETELQQVLSSDCKAAITDFGMVKNSKNENAEITEGDIVKIGFFDLKIVQINSISNGYSGMGTIYVPFLKANVAVSFEELRIKKDKRAFATGKIKSTFLQNFNLGSDAFEELSINQTLNEDFLTDMIRFSNSTAANPQRVSLRSESDQTPMAMPLVMDSSPNGTPILVLEMDFSERQASMNVLALLRANGGRTLKFSTQKVNITPNGVAKDAFLPLDNEYQHSFAGGNELLYYGKNQLLNSENTNSSFTKIAINCQGFENYLLAGEWTNPQIKIFNKDNLNQNLPIIFSATSVDFIDFIGTAKKLENITFPTTEGYVFSTGDGKIDFSTKKNIENIEFPKNYTFSKEKNWKGIYYDKVTTSIPNKWQFLQQNTATLDFTKGNLFINENGAYGTLKKENLISLEKGIVKDWKYSIEQLDLILQGKDNPSLEIIGKLKVSIVDNLFDYTAKLENSNNITANSDAVFFGTLDKKANLSLWNASLDLNPESKVQMAVRTIQNEQKIFPSANLSGKFNLSINDKTFSKFLLGNKEERTERVKRVLELSNNKISIDIVDLLLQNLQIDPFAPVSKRYILGDFGGIEKNHQIKIGDVLFPIGMCAIEYKPIEIDGNTTQNEQVSFQFTVTHKESQAFFSINAQKNSKGEFELFSIDVDTKELDCKCFDEKDGQSALGRNILNAENALNSTFETATAANTKYLYFKIKTLGGFKVKANTNDNSKGILTLKLSENWTRDIKVNLQNVPETHTGAITDPTAKAIGIVNQVGKVPAVERRKQTENGITTLELNEEIDNSFFEQVTQQNQNQTEIVFPLEITADLSEILPDYTGSLPTGTRLFIMGLEVTKAGGKMDLLFVSPKKETGNNLTTTYLKFGTADVLIAPNAIGLEERRFFLLNTIENDDAELPFTYKKSFYNNKEEGSYAFFTCHGFQHYNVQGEYKCSPFSPDENDNQKLFVPDVLASDETENEEGFSGSKDYFKQLIFRFTIKGNSTNNFITQLSDHGYYGKSSNASTNSNEWISSNFAVRNAEGQSFNVVGSEKVAGYLDFSNNENYSLHSQTSTSFKGLYLDKINIEIDGLKYYPSGSWTMGSETGRENLSLLGRAFTYSNQNGLNGNVEIGSQDDTTAILVGDISGWNYELFFAQYKIENNICTERTFQGQIQLPIVKVGQWIPFTGMLDYDYENDNPLATLEVDNLNSKRYDLSIQENLKMYLPSESSSVELTWNGNDAEFDAFANLNGIFEIGFDRKTNASMPFNLSLPLINFQNLQINNPDIENTCSPNSQANSLKGLRSITIESLGIGRIASAEDYDEIASSIISTGIAKVAEKAELQGFEIYVKDINFKCLMTRGTDGQLGTEDDKPKYKLDFEIYAGLFLEKEEDDEEETADSTTTTAPVKPNQTQVAATNKKKASKLSALFEKGKENSFGLAAKTQLGFWWNIEKNETTKESKLAFDKVSLDALIIKGNFKMVELEGGLTLFNADEQPKWGDGFKGYLRAYIGKEAEVLKTQAATGGVANTGTKAMKGGSPKGFGLEIQAAVQFGNTRYTESSGAATGNKYNYFFIDLQAISEKGIMMGKVALHGIGGGFYYNMTEDNDYVPDFNQGEQDVSERIASAFTADVDILSSDENDAIYNPGTNLSGTVYLPERGHYGGHLKTIWTVLGKPEVAAFDLGITLELEKGSSGSLALTTVSARGGLYLQAESVRAREDAALKGTVVAELNWQQNYFRISAILGEIDAPLNESNPKKSSKDQTVDYGSISLTNASLHFHLQYDDPADVELIGAKKGEWYLKLGKPALEDRITSRMRLNPPGITLFSSAFYLQIGHHLDPLPELSELIPNYDRISPASYGMRPSTSMFQTGNGIIFGYNAGIPTKTYSFLIFEATIGAMMGFDVSMMHYDEDLAPACYAGSKTITDFGIKRWYARGQIYAYARAKAAIKVNLFFYKGRYEIFDLMAAATLQAELPNPTWMKGYVYGRYRILGGLVSGEARFKWEVGERCQELAPPNPLAGITIVEEVFPEDKQTEVAVYSIPKATFMLPVGKVFVINQPQDPIEKSNGQVEMRPSLRLEFYADMIEFSVKEKTTNKLVSAKINLSEDGKSASLETKDLFKPYTDYVLNLRFRWKKNGQVIANSDENYSYSFKTGAPLETIPEQVVAQIAPAQRQRYWHKGFASPMLGFTIDMGTQTNIFQTSRQEQIETAKKTTITKTIDYEFVVRLTPYNTNGQAQEQIYVNLDNPPNQKSQLVTKLGTQIIGSGINSFSVPVVEQVNEQVRELRFSAFDNVNLQKGWLYEFEIVKQPILTNLNTGDFDYQVVSVKSADQLATTTNEDYTAEKTATKIGASNVVNLRQKFTKVLYTNYFGVSKYDNLADKINESRNNRIVQGNSTTTKNYKTNDVILNRRKSISTDYDIKTPSTFYTFKNNTEGFDKYDILRMRKNMKFEAQAHPYEVILYNGEIKKFGSYSSKNAVLPSKEDYLAKGNNNFDRIINGKNYLETARNFTKSKAFYYRDNGSENEFKQFADMMFRPHYLMPEWSYEVLPNSSSAIEITGSEMNSKKLSKVSPTKIQNLEGRTFDDGVTASFIIRNSRNHVLETQLNYLYGNIGEISFRDREGTTLENAAPLVFEKMKHTSQGIYKERGKTLIAHSDLDALVYYRAFNALRSNTAGQFEWFKLKNNYSWNGMYSYYAPHSGRVDDFRYTVENTVESPSHAYLFNAITNYLDASYEIHSGRANFGAVDAMPFIGIINVVELNANNSNMALVLGDRDLDNNGYTDATSLGGGNGRQAIHDTFSTSSTGSNQKAKRDANSLARWNENKGNSIKRYNVDEWNAKNFATMERIKQGNGSTIFNQYNEGVDNWINNLTLNVSFPKITNWENLAETIDFDEQKGYPAIRFTLKDVKTNANGTENSNTGSVLNNPTQSAGFGEIEYAIRSDKTLYIFHNRNVEIEELVVGDINGNKYYAQYGKEVEIYGRKTGGTFPETQLSDASKIKTGEPIAKLNNITGYAWVIIKAKQLSDGTTKYFKSKLDNFAAISTLNSQKTVQGSINLKNAIGDTRVISSNAFVEVAQNNSDAQVNTAINVFGNETRQITGNFTESQKKNYKQFFNRASYIEIKLAQDGKMILGSGSSAHEYPQRMAIYKVEDNNGTIKTQKRVAYFAADSKTSLTNSFSTTYTYQYITNNIGKGYKIDFTKNSIELNRGDNYVIYLQYFTSSSTKQYHKIEIKANDWQLGGLNVFATQNTPNLNTDYVEYDGLFELPNGLSTPQESQRWKANNWQNESQIKDGTVFPLVYTEDKTSIQIQYNNQKLEANPTIRAVFVADKNDNLMLYRTEKVGFAPIYKSDGTLNWNTIYLHPFLDYKISQSEANQTITYTGLPQNGSTIISKIVPTNSAWNNLSQVLDYKIFVLTTQNELLSATITNSDKLYHYLKSSPISQNLKNSLPKMEFDLQEDGTLNYVPLPFVTNSDLLKKIVIYEDGKLKFEGVYLNNQISGTTYNYAKNPYLPTEIEVTSQPVTNLQLLQNTTYEIIVETQTGQKAKVILSEQDWNRGVLFVPKYNQN